MDPFLSRCVERWHSLRDFEVQLVDATNFDLFLEPSTLPSHFRDLAPHLREDVLKVALLAHFGGLLMDKDSLPVQEDGVLQIWSSLQGSTAEVLGTYSYHQECQWSLGMWFFAAKKGSAFMQQWLKLVLQELGGDSRCVWRNVFFFFFFSDLLENDICS